MKIDYSLLDVSMQHPGSEVWFHLDTVYSWLHPLYLTTALHFVILHTKTAGVKAFPTTPKPSTQGYIFFTK